MNKEMDSEKVDFIKYCRICDNLNIIIKKEWQTLNVQRNRLESVAEHIHKAQMIAIAMKTEFGYYFVDIVKVIFMLAIHKLVETIIGDLTQSEITKEKKEKIEHDVVHKILNGLFDDKLDGKQIEELFLEFDEHKTQEATFAFQCEMLEYEMQYKQLVQSGKSWSNVQLFDQQLDHYDINFRAVSDYFTHNDKRLLNYIKIKENKFTLRF